MHFLKEVMELIFSIALFINGLLFIPQIISILRAKTSTGVSLITFGGFILIQTATVAHGLIHNDMLLVYGYLFSLATCAGVVVLTLFYRIRQK
jgi:MtN3 and saliva related transmembrane protein